MIRFVSFLKNHGLVIALIIAFLLVALNRQNNLDVVPDENSYFFTAKSLAAGEGFRETFDTGTTPSTWRPPLFSLFLAPFTGFATKTRDLSPFIVILAAITGLVLYLITLQIAAGRTAKIQALVAAALFLTLEAFSPLGLSQMVMSENLFTLLIWLALLSAFRSENSRILAFGCGALLGLATLTRASTLAFLPSLGLIFVGFAPRQRWSSIAWAALGAVCTLAPWALRNYLLHERLILTSTANAYNLFIANYDYPNALTGAHNHIVDQLRSTKGEVGTAEALMGLTKDWMLTHWQETSARIVRDFAANIVSWFRFGGKIFAAGVLLSFVGGILLIGRQGWKGLFLTGTLLTPLLMLFILHAVTFYAPRFFYPGIPGIIICLTTLIPHLLRGRARVTPLMEEEGKHASLHFRSSRPSNLETSFLMSDSQPPNSLGKSARE